MSHYKVLITQIVYPHKFILFFFYWIVEILITHIFVNSNVNEEISTNKKYY